MECFDVGKTCIGEREPLQLILRFQPWLPLGTGPVDFSFYSSVCWRLCFLGQSSSVLFILHWVSQTNGRNFWGTTYRCFILQHKDIFFLKKKSITKLVLYSLAVKCLPNSMKPWVQSPAQHKLCSGHTPEIPALRRWNQENQMFKATFKYTENLSPAWSARNPVWERKKNALLLYTGSIPSPRRRKYTMWQ